MTDACILGEFCLKASGKHREVRSMKGRTLTQRGEHRRLPNNPALASLRQRIEHVEAVLDLLVFEFLGCHIFVSPCKDVKDAGLRTQAQNGMPTCVQLKTASHAGARIDEACTLKLPVDPRLPMTGTGKADRKSLLPQRVFKRHSGSRDG